MPVIPNKLKQSLRENRYPVAFSVNRMHGPEVAAIAACCGFDWLFVDMEHSCMDTKTAGEICITALGWGITPIVRTSSHQPFHASRFLDTGAQGVVVPHVDTVEQARAVVESCRYTPMGRRSLARPSPHLRYANIDVAQAIKLLNENLLVIVMLETEEAIANADAIAAVEGVDAMLIGTVDLVADMGIPGQVGHERVDKAYEAAIKAAKRHGIYLGMGGIYDPVLVEKRMKQGVQFVVGSGDAGFMMTGAREQRAMLARVVESL